MIVTMSAVTGLYTVRGLRPDEAAALLRMIQGASLPERRVFNRLREVLEGEKEILGLLAEAGGRAHGREDGG